MYVYDPITIDNWAGIRSSVIALESVFPERIRAHESQLDRDMTNAVNIAFVARFSNQIVGYGLSEPMINRRDLPGCDEDGNDVDAFRTLYLSSCAVAKDHRGRGISGMLRQMRINVGHERAYRRFTAHVRTGKLGSDIVREVIRTFPNWYDYGSFDYVELKPPRLI